MSDEIVITEELINEFLDPLLSKAYAFKVEDTLPANAKYQVSFLDDQEKQYFVTFFRDNGLGKTSRKVVLSVKKNKSTTYKVNVDKGSFIKILGTFIQAYNDYKMNDPDGKLTNSYGFFFPDTFAKYMPFVVKVANRLFKTTPKLRLSLYGAVAELEGSTIMYFINASSINNFFGGPKADLNLIRGDFYHSLTGAKPDQPVFGNGAPEKPNALGFSALVQKTKSEVPTKTVKHANPTPVAKPEDVHPTSVDHVVNGNAPKDPQQPDWVDPIEGINFGGKEIKADTVVMLKDSGSSTLKKGQTAHIYGIYNKSTFQAEQCYSQFGITKNLVDHLFEMNPKSPYVLVVKTTKYVALPAEAKAVTDSFSNPMYYLLNSHTGDSIGKPKEDNSKSALSAMDDEEAAKNNKLDKFKDTFVDKKDAKNFSLPDEFFDKLSKINIKVGPTSIPIGEDLSIIGVADKLREIEDYFGKLPKDKINDIAYKSKMELDHHEREVSKLVNKILEETNHFFGDNASNDSVKAVAQYTGSSYSVVNKFLRGQDVGTMDKMAEKIVTGMDKGFVEDGVRFDKRLNVYRGASISQDDIAILDEGGPIPLTGYASVSLRPTIAYAFSNTGSKLQEIVRGALIDFDDLKSGKDALPKASFDSKQGNKIIYTINRLDRCLGIAVDKVSQNSGEDEIILNRGTKIQMRLGYKVQKVMDRAEDYNGNAKAEHGIWIAKVEIAPLAVSESSLKNYLLREAIQKISDVQDNLAIVSFYLEDVLEGLQK